MEPTKVKQAWDPWKMFDASKKEIENAQKRKALQQSKKAEFRKMVENPFKGGGQGGHILDPAMQRWYSARATAGDHFKMTKKTIPVLLFTYVIPVTLLTYLVLRDRSVRETSYRKGEVKTVDRQNKYVY